MKKLLLILAFVAQASLPVFAQGYLGGNDGGSTGVWSWLDLSGSGVTSDIFTNVGGKRIRRTVISGGTGSFSGAVLSNGVSATPELLTITVNNGTFTLTPNVGILTNGGTSPFFWNNTVTVSNNMTVTGNLNVIGTITAPGVGGTNTTIITTNCITATPDVSGTNVVVGFDFACLCANYGICGLGTQTVATLIANIGTINSGSFNGWETNKAGFAITVVRGTDGSDTYNVDGTKVALVGSNNVYASTTTNSYLGPVYHAGALFASNGVIIIGTTLLNGASLLTNVYSSNSGLGTITLGTGSATLNFGTGIVTNNDTAPLVLGGTLVVSNNATVTGTFNVLGALSASSIVGAVTSAVASVNGLVSNVTITATGNATISTASSANGGTITVNSPFYGISLYQGGTNFLLSAATMFITNAFTQGLTLNFSNNTLVFGGSISGLVAGAASMNLTNLSPASTDISLVVNTGSTSVRDLYYLMQAGSSPGNNSWEAIVWKNFLLGAQWTMRSFNGVSEWKAAFGLNGNSEGVFAMLPNLGAGGMRIDYAEPHKYFELSGGMQQQLVFDNGYDYRAGVANGGWFQKDISGKDHVWWFGNNPNYPTWWVKGATNAVPGAMPAGYTNVVMVDDMVGMGATVSTNDPALVPMAYFILGSNEVFLGAWDIDGGMSTNSAITGLSTNVTDPNQFGTNRFFGFYIGKNGGFGANYKKVRGLVLRDNTNGFKTVSILTNGLWTGSINGTSTNLEEVFIGPREEVASFVISTDANGSFTNYAPTFPRIDGVSFSFSNTPSPVLSFDTALVSNSIAATAYLLNGSPAASMTLTGKARYFRNTP